MRLILAKPASRDLKRISDYIAIDNPSAAQGVYQDIVEGLDKLREFPFLGRPGRHTATREWRIPALPYIVVYRLQPDAVAIVAILHTSREFDKAMRMRLNAS